MLPLAIADNECIMGENMKRPIAPSLPEGGTPAERLDMAFRRVLTVPKEEILRHEVEEKAAREKKKTAKKKPH